MVYTDNSPLVYIETSRLGASQICCLSNLSLFNYNIIYRSGRTNKATDALSQHPEPNCKLESDNDTDSDHPVMFCMPPFVASSSWSLVILKSHSPSRRKHRQLVIP